MLVVEIDVIDAETLEGGVKGLLDVLGLAADAPVSGVVFLAEVGEFGCEKDLVTALDVGGVEEVDAEIECAEDGCGGFFVVALTVDLAHAHATESHAGDDRAL